MRVIDADRLKAEIMGWCVVTYDLFGMGKCHEREIVLQAIEESPTIDAVPVVRGEWRFRSNGHNITRSGDYEEWHECSVCKLSADYPSSYCPNCGSYNGGDKA